MTMRGYTLLELVITITVAGIIMMLAIPSFTQWVSNSQVRTQAESLQNGLRFAQQEAARQNRPVSFTLSSSTAPTCSSRGASTSGTNWIVCVDNDAAIDTTVTPTPVVSYGKSGSAAATVTSDFSAVIFDGMGRTDLSEDATIVIGRAGKTCESAEGDVRCLNILLSRGGKVRMCDPQLGSGKPGACS